MRGRGSSASTYVSYCFISSKWACIADSQSVYQTISFTVHVRFPCRPHFEEVHASLRSTVARAHIMLAAAPTMQVQLLDAGHRVTNGSLGNLSGRDSPRI